MTLFHHFSQMWLHMQPTLLNSFGSNFTLADLTLIVGVSGGPDSLALLHLLQQRRLPAKLLVAHLNHQLRPEASADAAFVAETAASLNLPFAQKTTHIPSLAAQTRTSPEAAARAARYAFFAELAQTHAPAAVLVAHHADDQAETVLLHLLRGSGLAGLRGMQPVSPLPGAPHIPLARPLLTARRADIEQYCAQNHLQPRQDQTNDDPHYATRNRIRHELLPLLTDYNPQIVAALNQLAAITAADYDWLTQAADAALTDVVQGRGDGWLALDRAAVAALPLALQRLVLRQAALAQRPFPPDITLTHIEAARALLSVDGTAQIDLPANLTVQVAYDTLFVHDGRLPTAQLGPQLAAATPQPLPVPGTMSLANGWVIAAEWVPVEWASVRQNRSRWQAYIPAALANGLLVRGRQVGEAMQPLGMNGRSATLQDIMVNRQIPRHLRDHWPLIATDKHIVWVAGHVLDHRARLTAEMETAVRLTCHPPDNIMRPNRSHKNS